ncbi:Aerobic-type carbon monoxide dehydrogenase, middle subunit CoxM/CutM-like protein [Polynucleobacter duraquae]|jgi:carbon-monoxide dehydrogenase medium subunit|uniref:Aerobic-type carbon monoxide dehydrogenase, middle subunit CoxM/CutM-like protein n=1 Tax=Polynucleobacter duraquae TaxID=1835254 RepID=A0A0E3V1C0_9BURK|nr:xanthine dehydrogenase family protein subunit M [Polynucleobacter duraquae]AKD26009.1 Aerobic-type carbon monoxide dehydrogenase, middle subunit CoxM/CutM-like protein [Polynucleobacter duraquae]
MKPVPFNYLCAYSLEEALQHLRHSDDAKVIAGGQSLMPMLNFRVVQPSLLIDIGKLVELDFIREEGDQITIGSLTRHSAVASSNLVKKDLPVMHEALKHVAHLAIRNRGTIGGSLSHADPAAEYPMLCLLLDAKIYCESIDQKRTIQADKFFAGSLSTVLAEDEILTQIQFSKLKAHTGWAFEEFAQRDGDFALAAVGVLVDKDADSRIQNVKISMMGVGETALRLDSIESRLNGQTYSDGLLETVRESLGDFLMPNTDLHASSEYRLHLAGQLFKRNFKSAWNKATIEK